MVQMKVVMKFKKTIKGCFLIIDNDFFIIVIVNSTRFTNVIYINMNKSEIQINSFNVQYI